MQLEIDPYSVLFLIQKQFKLRKEIVYLILIFQIYSCKTITADKSLEIDGETKIRYIEMYESVCCPRDYKHDDNLMNYIKSFETENKIKLESNFKLQLGREGEAAYFISLENLSEYLQEKFVNERLKKIKTDDKSVINYLKNPISINKALMMWENTSVNSLIKI